MIYDSMGKEEKDEEEEGRDALGGLAEISASGRLANGADAEAGPFAEEDGRWI